MTRPGVHHLIVGPPQHGVTRYAELLVAAGGVPHERVTRTGLAVTPADLADLLTALPGGGQLTHLHLTDHLLGASPEEAAAVVTGLARHRRISLTLHDLPQRSDGRVQPRRAAAYAVMARAAVATVVSSRHEHGLLLSALGVSATPPTVTMIPLAVEAPCSSGPPPPVVAPAQRPPDVAVLGWVYPGKGHAEALDALNGLPADVGLAVLGGASPGHEELLAALRLRADQRGRRLTITGWVPDAELAARLRSVAVPVVAHRHISASGSLATWLSAGRRPVVTRSAYTEELGGRLPGALRLVDDDEPSLAAGIAAALHDPPSTWLGAEVHLGPSPAEAAHRLDVWLGRWPG